LAECIAPLDNGTGFVCTLSSPGDSFSEFGRVMLVLLSLLSGDSSPVLLEFQRGAELGFLLRGRFFSAFGKPFRLSDAGLVKLFRLLLRSRRLLNIGAGTDDSGY
jgi:hypothetical protein